MNTKKCKYCQEEIDKKAKRCPKCGGKFGLPGWVKALIIIVVIFACVIGCMNSCSNAVNNAVDEVNNAVDEVKNSYKDINGKTSFRVNETFQNKYEKITMTEVNTNFTDYNEYLGPSSGNKIIALKFEVENISKENDEMYVSSFSFHAYADGVAASTYIYGGNNYNDLSATLGRGKKSIGYVLYEVPVNATKVTVEYNADFWTDGTVIEFIVQE